MKRSWRYYASCFFAMLSDVFLELSMRVSGQERYKSTPEEEMTFEHKVFMRMHHPCQQCNGEGWVTTPTGDSAICPRCHGLDIDPEALKELNQ